MTEQVSIETPDGTMPAHLWTPASGSGPGILLLQEIFGVSNYIRRRAQDLADLGYVVLAPEIWWRLGVSSLEGPEAMGEAFGLLERMDWRAAVADGAAALEALRARPEVTGGTGIVGFCFGGGLGFDVAARTGPDVLVSFYGSALPELLGLTEEPGGRIDVLGAEAVTARSLHHFGLADSFLGRPMVESIRDALAPLDHVTFETYEADHAFDNDDFHLYDADASALAWSRSEAWLADNLPA